MSFLLPSRKATVRQSRTATHEDVVAFRARLHELASDACQTSGTKPSAFPTRLRGEFSRLDFEQNGRLTWSQLSSALKTVGFKLSGKDLSAAKTHLDPRKTGQVDWEEFCEAASVDSLTHAEEGGAVDARLLGSSVGHPGLHRSSRYSFGAVEVIVRDVEGLSDAVLQPVRVRVAAAEDVCKDGKGTTGAVSVRRGVAKWGSRDRGTVILELDRSWNDAVQDGFDRLEFQVEADGHETGHDLSGALDLGPAIEAILDPLASARAPVPWEGPLVIPLSAPSSRGGPQLRASVRFFASQSFEGRTNASSATSRRGRVSRVASAYIDLQAGSRVDGTDLDSVLRELRTYGREEAAHLGRGKSMLDGLGLLYARCLPRGAQLATPDSAARELLSACQQAASRKGSTVSLRHGAVLEAVQSTDLDGDGTLDFSEFVNLMTLPKHDILEMALDLHSFLQTLSTARGTNAAVTLEDILQRFPKLRASRTLSRVSVDPSQEPLSGPAVEALLVGADLPPLTPGELQTLVSALRQHRGAIREEGVCMLSDLVAFGSARTDSLRTTFADLEAHDNQTVLVGVRFTANPSQEADAIRAGYELVSGDSGTGETFPGKPIKTWQKRVPASAPEGSAAVANIVVFPTSSSAHLSAEGYQCLATPTAVSTWGKAQHVWVQMDTGTRSGQRGPLLQGLALTSGKRGDRVDGLHAPPYHGFRRIDGDLSGGDGQFEVALWCRSSESAPSPEELESDGREPAPAVAKTVLEEMQKAGCLPEDFMAACKEADTKGSGWIKKRVFVRLFRDFHVDLQPADIDAIAALTCEGNSGRVSIPSLESLLQTMEEAPEVGGNARRLRGAKSDSRSEPFVDQLRVELRRVAAREGMGRRGRAAVARRLGVKQKGALPLKSLSQKAEKIVGRSPDADDLEEVIGELGLGKASKVSLDVLMNWISLRPHEIRAAADTLQAAMFAETEGGRSSAIRATFGKLDADGKGTLDAIEFANGVDTILRSHRLPPLSVDPDELNQLFRVLDRSGNGDIDETEFLDFVRRHPTPSSTVLAHLDKMPRPDLGTNVLSAAVVPVVRLACIEDELPAASLRDAARELQAACRQEATDPGAARSGSDPKRKLTKTEKKQRAEDAKMKAAIAKGKTAISWDRAFALLDPDGSGEVTAEEFASQVAGLVQGTPLRDKHVKALARFLDLQRDGMVGRLEFISFCRRELRDDAFVCNGALHPVTEQVVTAAEMIIELESAHDLPSRELLSKQDPYATACLVTYVGPPFPNGLQAAAVAAGSDGAKGKQKSFKKGKTLKPVSVQLHPADIVARDASETGRIMGAVRRTATVNDGGHHPVWTSRHRRRLRLRLRGQEVDAALAESAKLRLSLFDDDTRQDDLIGQCDVDLSDLLSAAVASASQDSATSIGRKRGVEVSPSIKGRVTLSLRSHGGTKTAGTVTASVMFKPDAPQREAELSTGIAPRQWQQENAAYNAAGWSVLEPPMPMGGDHAAPPGLPATLASGSAPSSTFHRHIHVSIDIDRVENLPSLLAPDFVASEIRPTGPTRRRRAARGRDSEASDESDYDSDSGRMGGKRGSRQWSERRQRAVPESQWSLALTADAIVVAEGRNGSGTLNARGIERAGGPIECPPLKWDGDSSRVEPTSASRPRYSRGWEAQHAHTRQPARTAPDLLITCPPAILQRVQGDLGHQIASASPAAWVVPAGELDAYATRFSVGAVLRLRLVAREHEHVSERGRMAAHTAPAWKQVSDVHGQDSVQGAVLREHPLGEVAMDLGGLMFKALSGGQDGPSKQEATGTIFLPLDRLPSQRTPRQSNRQSSVPVTAVHASITLRFAEAQTSSGDAVAVVVKESEAALDLERARAAVRAGKDSQSGTGTLDALAEKDSDGRGHLPAGLVFTTLRTLGISLCDDDRKGLIAECSTDAGAGAVDYLKLCRLIDPPEISAESVVSKLTGLLEASKARGVNVLGIFGMLDPSGKGTLRMEDFKQSLGLALGGEKNKLSDEELTAVCKKFDTDGDGYVNHTEFVAAVTKLEQGETAHLEDALPVQELVRDRLRAAASSGTGSLREISTASLKAAFERADLSGDGLLSHGEFEAALRDLRLGLTDAELSRIIAFVDKDKSGTIDYVEFAGLVLPNAAPVSHRQAAAGKDAQQKASLWARSLQSRSLGSVLETLRTASNGLPTLTRPALRRALETAGLQLSQSEWEAVLDQADPQRVGEVNIAVFAASLDTVHDAPAGLKSLRARIRDAAFSSGVRQPDIRGVYASLDPGNLGTLGRGAIRSGLARLGVSATEDELRSIVSFFARDGGVDYAAFAEFVAHDDAEVVEITKRVRERLHQLARQGVDANVPFQLCDPTGTGRICDYELRSVAKQLGLPLTPTEVLVLCERFADPGKEDQIRYADMLRYVERAGEEPQKSTEPLQTDSAAAALSGIAQVPSDQVSSWLATAATPSERRQALELARSISAFRNGDSARHRQAPDLSGRVESSQQIQAMPLDGTFTAGSRDYGVHESHRIIGRSVGIPRTVSEFERARVRYNDEGAWTCPVCCFEQTRAYAKECDMCGGRNPFAMTDAAAMAQFGISGADTVRPQTAASGSSTMTDVDLLRSALGVPHLGQSVGVGSTVGGEQAVSLVAAQGARAMPQHQNHVDWETPLRSPSGPVASPAFAGGNPMPVGYPGEQAARSPSHRPSSRRSRSRKHKSHRKSSRRSRSRSRGRSRRRPESAYTARPTTAPGPSYAPGMQYTGYPGTPAQSMRTPSLPFSAPWQAPTTPMSAYPSGHY